MELKDMIYRRKSVRSYTGEPVDSVTIEKIKEFISGVKPLYPDIKVRAEIVERQQVRCLLPWITPQLIAIFSEEKEGFLENVGFMFQQLDLYLQSIGFGVCWLGMGQLTAKGAVETNENDNMRFVMMLTFGYPKGEALRKNLSEFKRKSLTEISDQKDERLEPARFAPSSVNSQPWYFAHEGDKIHTYCTLRGLFKNKVLGDMNQIDIGIALAHMYVTYPASFEFFKEKTAKPVKGHEYIGSFTI